MRSSASANTITLCLCVAALVGPARAQLTRQLVDSIKAATVYIEVTNRMEDGREDVATGSGVVFDADGLVLTNYHVIENRIEIGPNRYARADHQAIIVYFDHGTPAERAYEVTVVRHNRTADLALLALPAGLRARGNGPYPALPLGDSDQVFETQNVYAAGHPLGLNEISVRTGTITAKRTFGALPYLEHSVNVEHGSSGGPVVNDRGEIIGLVSFTLAAAEQNTNFAIPASTIKSFLSGTLPEMLQDGSGSSAAYLEALLEQSGLAYRAEDAAEGVFTVPYTDDNTGATVNLWISATPQWVLMQVFLGPIEAAGSNKRMVLYKALLEANFNFYIGKFGLDGDGDLWLEHHAARQDLSGAALSEYAETLATLALGYVSGELGLPK